MVSNGKKHLAVAGLVALGALIASALAGDRLLQTPAWFAESDIAPTETVLPDGRVLTLNPVGASKLTATMRSLDHGASPLALHTPRRAATATVLPNGKVLIWGGLDANSHVVAGGEWFDPSVNQLSEASDVALLPRAGQTATVLTDGRVLVTGGWNATAGFLSKAELWDYRNNHSEILATDLIPTRAGHSATVLADGRVLLLGGYDASGHRFLDGALFDPRQVAFVNVDASSTAALASVDPAAPEVADTVPADQAVDFPYDGLIALRFSVRMEVTSLQTQTVTLLGPTGPVAIRVVPAESGRLAFVQPMADLLPGSTYTLFVDGARATDGAPLAMKAISFTTAGSTPSTTAGKNAHSPPANGGTGGAGSTSPNWSNVTSGGTTMAAGSLALGVKPVAPHALRLVAGSAQANANFLSTCNNTQRIHGHRFCRDTGSVEGGIFIPGHSNTQARWRLNKPLPQLLTEKDFPAGTFRAGATSVFGVARRIDDTPLAGVSVSVGTVSAHTDAQGRFVLNGIPAGHQVLAVDGRSANRGAEEYGQFIVAVEVQADRPNAVPFNLYVPRIAARDKVSIPSPTPQATIVTHPAIPGLEIHIPAGVAFRDRAGKILTEFAIVPMPVDRSPVPVPQNFPVYFSLQPGGATVEGLTSASASGLRVVYPNYIETTQSEQAFWYYDAEQHGWDIYTTGQVSEDESQIIPLSSLGGITFMPQGGATVGSNQKPASTPPKEGCHAGDPVDCATGLFLLNGADLSLNDSAPLALTRKFNATDANVRAFGLGMSHSYGMYLYAPGGCTHAHFQTIGDELDLVMGDGSVYPFIMKSSDPMQPLTHAASPGAFYGAALYPPYPANRSPDPNNFVVQTQDGNTYHFSQGCPTLLSSIQDRFGNGVSFSYSAAGLLSSVTSSSGRSLSFTYNAQNTVSQVRDNAGRLVNYTYDGNSRLSTVTYADGTYEGYTYDGGGNIATVKDRAGNTKVTNVYDGANRVIQQTYADSSSYRFAYTFSSTSASIVATDVTDGNNNVKHIVFDGAGYPVSITQAYGTSLAQTTTLVRGQDELVTSRTDPLGRTTQYAYDSNGNVLKATYLAGTANAASYTYTYTPDFNQVSTVTDPLGHTTSYSYSNGCLTGVTDALGHQTTIACNAAGQPVAMTDANGHSEIFTYTGRDLHTATNALGQTTTFTTDGLGRVTAVQDALNRTASVVYDSFNDRITQSTDPMQKSTSYTYDGNSNLKTVTDPATGKTQFGYDGRNRPTSRTDALTKSESVIYDNMGNVLTATDRKGQQTRAQYDALNRPTVVTFADNSTVTPTFDAGNRLTQIVDSVSGTITRSYDSFDRLTQEQTPQGTVSYGYDAAGRRTSMTPANQAQITYGYDNANRLTQIAQGSQTVRIGYDNGNRRTSLTLPNGIVANYSYDNGDQVTAMTYTTSSGVNLATLGYTYDAAGQRTSRSGGFASEMLPTPTTSNGVFDLNNKQTQWNGFSLGYDFNGDPTSNNAPPAQSYTFDARHRLTQITQGGSAIASFQYDTFGRRTSKTVNGVTTSFLYDGQSAVQETQGSTISAILTGMGIDERFARDDASLGKAYYMTDALGSTLALADANQAVQQSYAYEPYGEVSSTGASNNPYQYTGRENDGTGLYYYRARYYSPSLKRFISEDPMGLYGGLNGYAYADGNPISFYDPYGLYSWNEFIDDSANFSAGAGDTLSFGVTRHIRSYWDIGSVNRCSSVYSAGEWTGIGIGVAMSGAGLMRGGLRLEMGNWKQGGEWFFRQGTRGPHFHWGSGLGLQTHHLPWQIGNWARNLWSLTKRGKAGEDWENIALLLYGSSIAASSSSSDCTCSQ